jgi:mannan endo-1,4-beta-mannosidase
MIKPGFILMVISSLLLLSISCTETSTDGFVTVRNGAFFRNEQPYYFMGANYWQGMNLATALPGGDTARMKRELDQMKNNGISNLRILAITEGPDNQPYRVVPALQDSAMNINETLWVGLDLLLSEMKKRGMTATVVLNNFWPWSGGMAQYVSWYTGDSIPYPPPHPNGNWDTYQKFAAKFYTMPVAKEHFKNVVKKLIERVNSVTGVPYKNDPAILAWELANEPRGMDKAEDMLKWIDETSKYIESLDPNHLITTGAEGYTTDPRYTGTDFIQMHSFPAIDYTTAHIWIQNWGWYDPKKHDSTYPTAEENMKSYLKKHAEEAFKMKKPFVLEEFGIMKDGGSFDPRATTRNRDKYYEAVFKEIIQLAKEGKANGVNFWAWAGDGEPIIPGKIWQLGDPLTGDPPHEPQGWYSVYAIDTATHRIIKTSGLTLTNLGKK